MVAGKISLFTFTHIPNLTHTFVNELLCVCERMVGNWVRKYSAVFSEMIINCI